MKEYEDFDINYFFESWLNGNKSHCRDLFKNAHPVIQQKICYKIGVNNDLNMLNFIQNNER